MCTKLWINLLNVPYRSNDCTQIMLLLSPQLPTVGRLITTAGGWNSVSWVSSFRIPPPPPSIWFLNTVNEITGRIERNKETSVCLFFTNFPGIEVYRRSRRDDEAERALPVFRRRVARTACRCAAPPYASFPPLPCAIRRDTDTAPSASRLRRQFAPLSLRWTRG